MTAPQVLASLRARGIAIAAAGDRLRIRPAGVLTDADRELLTAMKPALLQLLGDARVCAGSDGLQPTPALAAVHASLTPEECARLVGEARGGEPLAQLVLDAVACIPEPAAWRLYSRRLDRELWVARDADAAAQLDRDGARGGLPVLLAADLERLRDVDDQRLGDLLEVLAVFPGARLAQLEPEATS